MHKVNNENSKRPSLSARFLVSNEHPIVLKYEETFKEMIGTGWQGMNVILHPAIVENKDINSFVEIIAAAQHYPESLEKMIFKVRIGFSLDGNTIMTPEENAGLLNTPIFQKWINYAYQKVPHIIFLLDEKVLRFYAMTGEYSQDDFNNPIHTSTSILGVNFLPEKADEIEQSFQNASIYFLDYCLVAGIDPKPFIIKAFEDMGFEVDYDIMKETYDEIIASSILPPYVLPQIISKD
jgi:hypothetical protein